MTFTQARRFAAGLTAATSAAVAAATLADPAAAQVTDATESPSTLVAGQAIFITAHDDGSASNAGAVDSS